MAAGAGTAGAAPAESATSRESSSTSNDSAKSDGKSTSSQKESADTSESPRKRNASDRRAARDSDDSSDTDERTGKSADEDSDAAQRDSDGSDNQDDSDTRNDSGLDAEPTEADADESSTDEPATETPDEVEHASDSDATAEPTAEPERQVEAAPAPGTVTAVAPRSNDSDSPVAPAAPHGILGWIASLSATVQREVDYFVNGGSAPVTTPIQLGVHQGTGAVRGAVNAVGDPRDTLTYTVITGPTAGTVTIGANGSYLYTPSSFPTEDLTDSFTVAIRNTGFNVRSLMAVFNPSLNTTLVNVGVNVAGMEAPGESNNTTRGFNITNWTQYDLRLTKADGHDNFDGPVPINSVLKPGETQHFEIILSFLHTDTGVVYYESLTPGGTNATIAMTIEAAAFDYVDMSCRTNNCWMPGSAHAYILEAPDTVVEVHADKPDLQSAILDQFCYSGSAATCSFKGTERTVGFDALKEVVTLRNPANGEFHYNQTLKTTVTEKHSVTLSAKVSANVLSIVNEEINGQWGNEWSKTLEHTETFKPVVSAWSVGTVYAASPIIRYTGDFTIQLGNTTLILRDVDFDKPDPSGGRHSTWSYVEVPIPRSTDSSTSISV